jgi:hypothetical protein
VSLLGEWQSGHGWLWFPKLLLVHQAYSHVFKIAVVVQGLQVLVIMWRLSMAFVVAVVSWSEVKNCFHRL